MGLIGSQTISAVLDGAVDLHVHGYPETRADILPTVDDVTAATSARDMGLAGWLLKSHLWPTMGRAYHINRCVPEFEVFPSITLNSLVGGLAPELVEIAALQGARGVFLPTWSSTNDIHRKAMSVWLEEMLPSLSHLAPPEGLSLLDDRGKLRPEVGAILEVTQERGLVVGTGHTSPREAIAVARTARRIGFERLVFTHPAVFSVGATLAEMVEAADLGAYVELSFVGMLPAHGMLRAGQVIDIITKVGAERCVVTSDCGFDVTEAPAGEMLRLFVATLLHHGVPQTALRTMLVDNPRRILGLA